MTQNLRNLNDIMQAEVENYVESFKQDLALDLDDLKKDGGGYRYVWLLRRCGTVLMRRDHLNYRNSLIFTGFEYYHPSSIEAAFEIEVETVENNDLIGSCQLIKDYENYYQQLLSNAQISEWVTFEIEQQTGEINQYQIPIKPNGFVYADCLRVAELDFEDVARFNILSYE